MKEHPVTSKDIVIKKMHGEKLTPAEIKMVLDDIVSGKFGEIEITSWLVALYINRMDDDEIIAYTKALVNTGSIVKFDRKDIYDFHSIGGISGNKITPMVVSVVSAAGLMIPKTSTHAISSACGTVDFVETFCRTEFSKDDMVRMAKKTKGLFVMGGFEDHCPADDIIIKVEHTIKLNPYAQFFPSILGKKLGMSVSKLLIEIPTGPTAKMRNIVDAKSTARDFIRHGKKLGIDVRVAISDANQPIGHCIGPVLEARECISSLQHPEIAPKDIIEKVCSYSATIMEMGGIKDAQKKARDILFSGKAYQKFREIVEIQGGDPNVQPEDLALGKSKAAFVSPVDGYVSFMDNKELIQIARKAGSPNIKVAGILIHKKIGDKVSKGDILMEIYSDSKRNADDALKLAKEILPYEYSEQPVDTIGSVVLDTV